jgi:hypothetical protein
MRTKALLLAAAFAAAGVATSMAQVYSVNAVGYVNTTLTPGFTLISNPLLAADNKIETLFSNFQGGIRDQTTVYKFIPATGNFQVATYFELLASWSGDGVGQTTVPGEGVFVFLPDPGAGEAANKVLTFVGEVPQGPTSVTIPKGFSIISSPVPQAVSPDSVKNTDTSSAAIAATDGDTIYHYNTTTKGFDSNSFSTIFGGWDVSPLPPIKVGEAVYYFRTGASTTWTRTFDVNNPQ